MEEDNIETAKVRRMQAIYYVEPASTTSKTPVKTKYWNECSKCGFHLPTVSKYCPNCGVKLEF